MSPKTMEKSSPFAQKLAKLKGTWGKAAVEAQEGGNFKDLPPGRYLTQITDGEVNESKGSGRLQFFLEFTVLEGEQAGESQRRYWGLDKPENLKYVHQALMAVGYQPPEDPSELEATIREIVKDKPQVKIRMKENGEYMNLLIEGVVGGQPAAPAETEPEAAPAQPEAPAEQPAAPAEAEDDGSIKEGKRFFVISAESNGVVVSVNEADAEVTLKLDSTGKKVIVGPDDLQLEKVIAPAQPKAPAGLKVLKAAK